MSFRRIGEALQCKVDVFWSHVHPIGHTIQESCSGPSLGSKELPSRNISISKLTFDSEGQTFCIGWQGSRCSGTRLDLSQLCDCSKNMPVLGYCDGPGALIQVCVTMPVMMTQIDTVEVTASVQGTGNFDEAHGFVLNSDSGDVVTKSCRSSGGVRV